MRSVKNEELWYRLAAIYFFSFKTYKNRVIVQIGINFCTEASLIFYAN